MRIPAKGITGTIVDKYRDPTSGVVIYMVQNHEWGDVDDPDAWNSGYAFFDCTADQLEHVKEDDKEQK